MKFLNVETNSNEIPKVLKVVSPSNLLTFRQKEEGNIKYNKDELRLFTECKNNNGFSFRLCIFQEPIAESSTDYAHREIMANNVKIESDDDSLSDDSLEVSDTVTGVTNLTSDTILDSPDKISCALCVTRTKGNKHQQGRQESGQQYPLLVLRKLFVGPSKASTINTSHVTVTQYSKFPC